MKIVKHISQVQAASIVEHVVGQLFFIMDGPGVGHDEIQFSYFVSIIVRL